MWGRVAVLLRLYQRVVQMLSLSSSWPVFIGNRKGNGNLQQTNGPITAAAVNVTEKCSYMFWELHARLKAAFISFVLILSTFLHVFSKLKVTLLRTGNSGDSVLQHSKYFKQDQLNKRKTNTLGNTMKLVKMFLTSHRHRDKQLQQNTSAQLRQELTVSLRSVWMSCVGEQQVTEQASGKTADG